MLTHQDIWNAIDRLAQAKGMSPSGLAKKAGLSSTLFNPSKRQSASRLRWPSTESIIAILRVTDTSWEEFVAYTRPEQGTVRKSLPMLSLKDAVKSGGFDMGTGALIEPKWDKMQLPAFTSQAMFALEISNKAYEPVYPEGTFVILSPEDKARRADRVGVLTRRGDLFLRQLGREGLHKVELLPLGPETSPVTLSRSDILWLYRIIWASQ